MSMDLLTSPLALNPDQAANHHPRVDLRAANRVIFESVVVVLATFNTLGEGYSGSDDAWVDWG